MGTRRAVILSFSYESKKAILDTKLRKIVPDVHKEAKLYICISVKLPEYNRSKIAWHNIFFFFPPGEGEIWEDKKVRNYTSAHALKSLGTP